MRRPSLSSSRLEEFQVATVGGGEELGEVTEAVEALLDGREFGLIGAVALFHLPVVLEGGDVVRNGLDTQNLTELVVHLDGKATHLMAIRVPWMRVLKSLPTSPL